MISTCLVQLIGRLYGDATEAKVLK